jgi:hypothetical protein
MLEKLRALSVSNPKLTKWENSHDAITMLTFKFREDTLDGTLLHRTGQFMCQAKQAVQLMGAITIKQASIPSQRCCSNSHCPNGMADIMIAIPGHIQNHPQNQQSYSSTLKDPGFLGLGLTSPYRDQD